MRPPGVSILRNTTIVMLHLCPLLTGLLLLASPAEQPADAPSGWQAMPEKYAALDPAAQQQWIRGLLGRLDRANRAVLSPREAAGQRTRHAELLRQMARDRTIPHGELLELLRQTDQREKAAIERLARQFRIRVYDTFRLQRSEYARRRAAWNRTLSSWKAAGGPFDRQHRLIDWLEAAVRNSTPGSIAPLPPMPKFAPTPKFDLPKLEPFADAPHPLVPQRSVDRIVQPRPQVVTPEPPEPLPPIPSLPEPKRRSSDLPTPRQTTGREMQPSGPLMPPPVPVVPHQSPDQPPDSRRAAAHGPSTAPVRLPVELPLVAERSTPMPIPPIQAASPSVAFVAGLGPRRTAEALPAITGQPVTILPPSDRPLLLVPPPAVAQRLRSTDRPAVTANRARQRPSRTVGRPEASLAKSDHVPPETSAQRINLAELAARTAGANLALQTLEAQLDENRRWNARQLAPLVDRLRFLVMRSNDLALFHDLISPPQQAQVGRLESPRAVISRVAARIVQARTHASGPKFIGTQAQRRAELGRLDELSRQLAEMALQE